MPDLSMILAVAAVALSLLALWRSELRGSHVRCLPVPGSTAVAVGISTTELNAPGPRLLVNVWRSLVFANDSARPAYLSELTCSSGGPIHGCFKLDVGVAGAKSIVPQEHIALEEVVGRDQPLRAVVTWWLVLEPDQEEAVKAVIRDPNGPLWMDVEWSVLESFFVWPRFKKRKIRIRPKADKAESVSWRGAPSSL